MCKIAHSALECTVSKVMLYHNEGQPLQYLTLEQCNTQSWRQTLISGFGVHFRFLLESMCIMDLTISCD